jgi:phosphoglycolate phosphatase
MTMAAPTRVPVAGVVFDKDGTLFDFQATWGGWTVDVIASEAGPDRALAARIAALLGFDPSTGRFVPGAMAITDTTAEIAEAMAPLLPALRQAGLQDRLNTRSLALRPIPAADLPRLTSRLRDMGLQLGVATNDAETPARAHLQHAGVGAAFAAIYGYDSGFGGKPAPGQLLAFCNATGLPAAACVMVGDSLHDLVAARAAGMRAVGVLTGPASAADLAPCADVVLPSIADLPDWIAVQG